MSNSGTAGSREIKKVMRTALIGIKPADLIMLKGYLRVLLRLEADLEWVPASHPNIDLYVINDEFRGSASVNKILRDQPKNKVLYVRRSDDSEGMMSDNLIILPLQNLKALSSWLYTNLPFLQNNTSNASSEHNTDLDSNTTSSDDASSQAEDEHQAGTGSEIKPSTSSHTTTEENGLLSVIETIQERPEGLYELACDKGKIALVNLARQRIWLVGEGSVAPNKSWKLTPTTRAVAPDITKSTDLFQWLWQQAWNTPDNLLPMVSDEQTYQLRFWPKPRMTTSRKELAHLLTAMEAQPILVRDLAVRAETSVNSAKKVVAGLLLAGGLHDETYKHLKEHGISISKPTSSVASSSSTVTTNTAKPSTPTKHKRSLLDDILARRSSGDTGASPQSTSNIDPDSDSMKQEKLGFLAKIRRKLGL